MTIPASTLLAIQKVGAAAFAADLKLKASVKEYADRVSAAVSTTPDNSANDALIEKWKRVARLSQSLQTIEDGLKAIYQGASELVASDSVEDQVATVKSAAPVAAKVEVVAKVAPKVARAKKVKKASKPKAAKASDKALVPQGNAAKMLSYFEGALNANEFVTVNQSAAGRESGVPMGSVAAAIKRLLELGCITAGPASSYKLTAAAAKANAVGTTGNP